MSKVEGWSVSHLRRLAQIPAVPPSRLRVAFRPQRNVLRTGRSGYGSICWQLASASQPADTAMSVMAFSTTLSALFAVFLVSNGVRASGQQQSSGTCPRQQNVPDWYIDSNTPASACTKSVCTGTYQQCMDATTAEAASDNLVLVFSDEFNGPRRDMQYQYGDRIWTAVDMYYDSNRAEQQVYKPTSVVVKDGAMHITMYNKTNTAPLHDHWGNDVPITRGYTSGMAQSWNKVCFTGGRIEFSLKLPGTADASGLWGAAWLEGNLGRAGHYRSTTGHWPYSYDTCDGSGQLSWSENVGQRINECNNRKGRGAPEIDVIEYGIFPRGEGGPLVPTYIHTLQMAPVAPKGTSWLIEDPNTHDIVPKKPGAYIPGVETYVPARESSGVMTATDPNDPEVTYWRIGSNVSDSFTASTPLSNTHFDSYHTYSVLWEPGEYIRWYLDDQFLFEVNKEALRSQSTSEGSVGDRLIPMEAMYLIINLAISNSSWSRVSPELKFPATMSVDYVRVYQHKEKINVRCDPPEYPTWEEIACNKDEYVGSDEYYLWDLGICPRWTSQSNMVFLCLTAAAALISIVAAISSMVMASRYYKLHHSMGHWEPTSNELAAARAADGEAGCYVTTRMLSNPIQLAQMRPDLMALAARKSR